MNFIQAALAAKGKSLGSVVHIGAGKCAELDTYLALQATRIVLVEGSERFAKMLQKRAVLHDNLLIRHCVVVPGSKQTVTFNIYSDERFNSVLDINPHYSGQQLVGTEKVQCVAMSSLLEDIEQEEASANLLVIEARGCELQLLKSASQEELRKFDFAIVSSARSPIYEGGSAANDVKSFMLACDYQPALFSDKGNTHIEQLYSLSNTSELEFARKQVGDLEAQLDELNRDRIAQIAVLESKLDKLDRDRIAQIAVLESKLDKLDQDRISEVASLHEQMSDLEEKLGEYSRDRRLAQKLLAKNQVDLDDIRLKYAEKLEREQALVELIMELRDKLQAASSYYFQLQNSHPEILAGDLD